MYLTQLIAHLGWADDLVLASLRSATAPDPRALEVFSHILAAEHVWLARLQGARPRHPVWPALTLEECAAMVQGNQRELSRYVAGLAAADLDRGITYTNSAGREFTSRVEDILLQVCLHGCYHRGAIAWALRAGGSVPMATDYIAFVRGAPAATRAESKTHHPE